MSAAGSAPAAGAIVVQAGERRSAVVESLRALAALGVLGFHAQLVDAARYGYHQVTPADRILSVGSQGVYLFFTLTGYLLFRPFAQQAWGDGTPVDLRRYARNRILRILPLYYAAVVVLLVVQEHGGTATQWWRFPLFLENFWLSSNQTVDGPLWSIVVELQFYLLLPVLALGARQVARRAAGLWLAALTVATLAMRVALLRHGWQHDLVLRTSFPMTAVYFTPGLLLAWLDVSGSARWTRKLPFPLNRSSTWCAVAVGLWVLVPLAPVVPGEILLVADFLMLGGCVLALHRGWPHRLLGWRPLAGIGVVSYSLYVWHVPILNAIVGRSAFARDYRLLLLVGGALSIAAAVASYAVIERPFLRRRQAWTATIAVARATARGPMPSTE